MSDLNNSETLTVKEKFGIVVQAGLQLIPYGIGASLSSLYFSTKQEKRFKRLEYFYKKLAKDVKAIRGEDLAGINEKIKSLDEKDRESFAAIIEEINEKIEREHIEKKIEFFKNFFINNIIEPVKSDNFDESRFFIDTLASMTLLECELLGFIFKQNHSVEVISLQRDAVDKYAIVGAVTRLINYGFLESSEIRYTAENPLNDLVRVTSFGTRFSIFCLNPPGV